MAGFNLNAQDYELTKITEEIKEILLLDSKNRLWFSNGEYIMMYDGKIQQQEVTHWKNCSFLWEDPKGNIWGTSEEGFLRFNNGKWTKFNYEKAIMNGSKTTLCFYDENDRMFVINKSPKSDYYVSIHENETYSYITENLPEKIERISQYKGGVLFGEDYKKGEMKPCGFYNGEYKLLTEGNLYQFFNKIDNRVLAKGFYLADNEIFKKYEIEDVTVTMDAIILLTKNLAACYFYKTDEIKEFKIAEEYQKLASTALRSYYYNNKVYLATEKGGVLEIGSNATKLFDKKNGLADNQLDFYFIDNNNNFVLMHPEESSVLIDGNWKHFDAESGYDLDNRLITDILDLGDNIFLPGFHLTTKKNKLLQWDGEKWKTFDFETKFKYISRISPFVFDEKIWFFNHNGNTYKGLLYFNGKNFIEFPLGEKVKDNWITSVSSNEKVIFVHSNGMGGSSLFKIVKKG